MPLPLRMRAILASVALCSVLAQPSQAASCEGCEPTARPERPACPGPDCPPSQPSAPAASGCEAEGCSGTTEGRPAVPALATTSSPGIVCTDGVCIDADCVAPDAPPAPGSFASLLRTSSAP
jgi:hypothetical protein